MKNYLFWKRFAQGKLKTHVSSVKIRMPSPKEILSWSERRLPNSALVGKIDNAHTVEHDTLKPVSGGLFCERIFGPIATNVCACRLKKGWNEEYCKICEVQFTKSRLRRYQMGHIVLAAPVIHVWALQGSYLANLLGKKNLGIRSIAYGKVMCYSKLCGLDKATSKKSSDCIVDAHKFTVFTKKHTLPCTYPFLSTYTTTSSDLAPCASSIQDFLACSCASKEQGAQAVTKGKTGVTKMLTPSVYGLTGQTPHHSSGNKGAQTNMICAPSVQDHRGVTKMHKEQGAKNTGVYLSRDLQFLKRCKPLEQSFTTEESERGKSTEQQTLSHPKNPIGLALLRSCFSAVPLPLAALMPLSLGQSSLLLPVQGTGKGHAPLTFTNQRFVTGHKVCASSIENHGHRHRYRKSSSTLEGIVVTPSVCAPLEQAHKLKIFNTIKTRLEITYTRKNTLPFYQFILYKPDSFKRITQFFDSLNKTKTALPLPHYSKKAFDVVPNFLDFSSSFFIPSQGSLRLMSEKQKKDTIFGTKNSVYNLAPNILDTPISSSVFMLLTRAPYLCAPMTARHTVFECTFGARRLTRKTEKGTTAIKDDNIKFIRATKKTAYNIKIKTKKAKQSYQGSFFRRWMNCLWGIICFGPHVFPRFSPFSYDLAKATKSSISTRLPLPVDKGVTSILPVITFSNVMTTTPDDLGTLDAKTMPLPLHGAHFRQGESQVAQTKQRHLRDLGSFNESDDFQWVIFRHSIVFSLMDKIRYFSIYWLNIHDIKSFIESNISFSKKSPDELDCVVVTPVPALRAGKEQASSSAKKSKIFLTKSHAYQSLAQVCISDARPVPALRAGKAKKMQKIYKKKVLEYNYDQDNKKRKIANVRPINQQDKTLLMRQSIGVQFRLSMPTSKTFCRAIYHQKNFDDIFSMFQICTPCSYTPYRLPLSSMLTCVTNLRFVTKGQEYRFIPRASSYPLQIEDLYGARGNKMHKEQDQRSKVYVPLEQASVSKEQDFGNKKSCIEVSYAQAQEQGQENVTVTSSMKSKISSMCAPLEQAHAVTNQKFIMPLQSKGVRDSIDAYTDEKSYLPDNFYSVQATSSASLACLHLMTCNKSFEAPKACIVVTPVAFGQSVCAPLEQAHKSSDKSIGLAPVTNLRFVKEHRPQICTICKGQSCTHLRCKEYMQWPVAALRAGKANKISKNITGPKVMPFFVSVKPRTQPHNLAFTGSSVLLQVLENINLIQLNQLVDWKLKKAKEHFNSFLLQNKITKKKRNLRNKLAKTKIVLTRRKSLIISFLNTKQLPEWMILSILPVLPPALRPILELETNNVVVSDLNVLYQTVIRRNDALAGFLTFRALEIDILNRQVSLQQAIEKLFDKGAGTKKRPLKSLSQGFHGKKGLFRLHLLGKRVDYSGRSVIVVGPQLKLYECGLPKDMALVLFLPFLIARLKRRKVVNTTTQAKQLIIRKDKQIWNHLKALIYEHPVLLNRAPTLHRLGFQAFQPILVSGKAMILPALVCTGFNADFDGDQMAVHVPLSYAARAESWKLLYAKNNLLSPATGKPVIILSQEMILGCYSWSLILNNAYSRRFHSSYFLPHSWQGVKSTVNQGAKGIKLSLKSKKFSIWPKATTILRASEKQLLPTKETGMEGYKISTRKIKMIENWESFWPCQHGVQAQATKNLPRKIKNKKTFYFTTFQEIYSALGRNNIGLQTAIWFRIPFNESFEDNSFLEEPLEIRLDVTGHSIRSYSQSQRHFSKMIKSCNQKEGTCAEGACFSYIRTTAGRIQLNETFYSSIITK